MIQDAWYIAAESAELKQKPVACTIADQEIVLFRDRRGQAHALFDRCPHRNVQLSKGRVVQGHLQCSYHGWEFNPSGQCVKIPALADQNIIPKAACTRRFPIIEQQGYIWVWTGKEAPTKQDQPFDFPHFSDSKWGWGRLQGHINNSVANIVENFIDNPHTGYIHGGLFRTPASHWSDTYLQMSEDGVVIDIEEENAENSLLAKLLVKGQVTHQDQFIYPSIVRVAYGFGSNRQMIGYQICTPETALSTRLYVHVSWRMGLINPLVKTFMPLIGNIILKQDVDILENQGQMIAKYGEEFVSIEADAANLWIKAATQRLARGEKPKPRQKRVRFRV